MKISWTEEIRNKDVLKYSERRKSSEQKKESQRQVVICLIYVERRPCFFIVEEAIDGIEHEEDYGECKRMI